jgi:hypothetical protein
MRAGRAATGGARPASPPGHFDERPVRRVAEATVPAHYTYSPLVRLRGRRFPLVNGKLTVAANDHGYSSRSTPRRPAERAALVVPIRELRERVDLVGMLSTMESFKFSSEVGIKYCVLGKLDSTIPNLVKMPVQACSFGAARRKSEGPDDESFPFALIQKSGQGH